MLDRPKVQLTPRQAFEGFSAFDDQNQPLPHWRGRGGRVPIEQLAGLVDHHTMREVSVSTENFGLVVCPKRQVLQRLYDDYFARRCKRVAEEKGVVIEASIHLTPLEGLKHEAYRMSIHTIAGWVGDGKTLWLVG